MKKITVGLSMLLLTACVSWYKPGAKQGEFEQDKYQCLQESQQRVSVAQANAYGGAAVSNVQTNDMLFANCMNAKGWRLQNNQVSQQQAQQQQANMQAKRNEVRSQMDQFKAQADAICTNPAFKAYYEKTACRANDISFAQLADQSKITAAQKIVLVKQRDAISDYYKQRTAYQRSLGGRAAKEADLYNSFLNPQNEQLSLELYNGKITWGEFNKRRKDLNAQFIEKSKTL